MKTLFKMLLTAAALSAICSCGEKKTEEGETFKYLVEQFADLNIIRYQVPGWDNLSLRQKEYVYHLSEAAKWGRDITWDQYCKWNIPLRHVLEDAGEHKNDSDESPQRIQKTTICHSKKIKKVAHKEGYLII